MNKCEHFCNGHCAYDCPNIRIDEWEDRFDLPCSEIGVERVKCSECEYYDRNMTCKDCYFFNTFECPEYVYDKIVKEWVHSKQYPALGNDWKKDLLSEINKNFEGDNDD